MRPISELSREIKSFIYNFHSIIFFKRSVRKLKSIPSSLYRKKNNKEISRYNSYKVSIFIIIEKDSENIFKGIDSALSQSYKNLEVIVLLDPDQAPKANDYLIKKKNISNSHLIIIHHFENGISDALNDAIIQSDGDWITVIKGNEWFEKDGIESIVKKFSSKPGVIFGIIEHSNAVLDQSVDKSLITSELAEKSIFSQFFVHYPTSYSYIINKKVFLRTGLYDSRFQYEQDYDIALKSAFHFPDSHFERLEGNSIFTKNSSDTILNINRHETSRVRAEARLRSEIRTGVFNKFVSFIILSYEKKEMTIKCIELIQSMVKIPHEIILFDNGSLPESQEYLRTHLSDINSVHLTFSDKNLGCPGGRHEAVKLAKGDYIIYLDNDIFITEGWIEELLIKAQSDEKIMAVTSKSVFPNGKVQFNGGKYQISDGLIKFTLLDEGVNENDIRAAKWHSCDWVPGGATLYKKEIIDKIDFSAGYINAFEDNDIALQIHNLGFKVVNCPSAKVYHNHIYFEDRKSKTEKRYIQARYNNDGLIRSFLNFYKRNNLILEDTFIFSLFSLNGKSNKEIKDYVKGLLKEFEH